MTEIRQLREIAERFPRLLIVSMSGDFWVNSRGWWQSCASPTTNREFIEAMEREVFSADPPTLATRWQNIIEELDLK